MRRAEGLAKRVRPHEGIELSRDDGLLPAGQPKQRLILQRHQPHLL